VKTGHPGERPNQNSINLDARDVLSQEVNRPGKSGDVRVEVMLP
jgi:hypothetical protein